MLSLWAAGPEARSVRGSPEAVSSQKPWIPMQSELRNTLLRLFPYSWASWVWVQAKNSDLQKSGFSTDSKENQTKIIGIHIFLWETMEFH